MPTQTSAAGLKAGDAAPVFELLTDEGQTVSLKDFKNKKIVLYFYPKDSTPGCTEEACDFRDGLSRIAKKGAVVLGVSADSVESHQKFKKNQSLNFTLLSDPEKKMIQRYGVWKEKSLYGKKYIGIERTTFIIGGTGKIEKVFEKVKVKGHYEEVLSAL